MDHPIDFPICESCPNREHSLFCDLDKGELEKIDLRKGCHRYKKGQSIFLEGSRPTGLYCISEGKAKVYRRGDEGREQIVRLALNGDVLGYRSLISEELYEASAEALDETTVCFIPRDLFFELVKSNRDFAIRLLKKLSEDLKKAEASITDLAQKPVKERLASTLIMLLDTYGLDKDGKSLGVLLTREDIANITGTATETVIRLLSEFKKEGLIKVDGRKIQITDHPGILKMANFFD